MYSKSDDYLVVNILMVRPESSPHVETPQPLMVGIDFISLHIKILFGWQHKCQQKDSQKNVAMKNYLSKKLNYIQIDL